MKPKICVNSRVSWAKLFFCGSFSKKLCDVKIYKIGVMENNRFDRALDLVPLVAMRGDDVQHLPRNAVLVSERDSAERLAHLLPDFSLVLFARGVLVIFHGFAYVAELRTLAQVVA